MSGCSPEVSLCLFKIAKWRSKKIGEDSKLEFRIDSNRRYSVGYLNIWIKRFHSKWTICLDCQQIGHKSIQQSLYRRLPMPKRFEQNLLIEHYHWSFPFKPPTSFFRIVSEFVGQTACQHSSRTANSGSTMPIHVAFNNVAFYNVDFTILLKCKIFIPPGPVRSSTYLRVVQTKVKDSSGNLKL